MKKNGEIKVCLVGSSGGHLTHLYMLKPFWKDKNRFWVTFDKEDGKRKGSSAAEDRIHNNCIKFPSHPILHQSVKALCGFCCSLAVTILFGYAAPTLF